MDKNIAIGILVIVVLGLGAYLIWGTAPASNSLTLTSTSTPSSATSTAQNGSPGGTVTHTAGMPTATTGTLIIASNSTAALSGKVVPNGAQTTYWYEYGTTASFGSRTSAQPAGSGYVAISTPAYLTNLSANTTYYARLIAQNSYGTDAGSTYSFSTNSNPPPSGHAPSVHTGSATSIARTGAQIAGTINPGGADTSVWFEYGTSATFGTVSAFEKAGSGTNDISLSVALSGLNPSTKYYYRVDAQNAYGTVTGATQTFTTLGPPAPGQPAAATLAATKVATSSLTMNGQVNPDGDTTTYWFEYGTTSLLGSLVAQTTIAHSAGAGTSAVAVSIPVANLSANTTYYYRLVAQNSYGTVVGSMLTVKTKTR